MIDFILVSRDIQVMDAQVDRSMFTTHGRRLEYRAQIQGRCMGQQRYYLGDLRQYSDHWAVWADVVFS